MRLQMLAGETRVASADLIAVEGEVRDAIERLRSLTFELRPSTLDREGLGAALRLYLEHTSKTTGWQVELRDDLEEEPDPDLRAVLYRIGQEAVQNARKHAGASSVRVELASRDRGVSLAVSDDGRGFTLDPSAAPEPGHLGLSTLVERAELAGGRARIESRAGIGHHGDVLAAVRSGEDVGLQT